MVHFRIKFNSPVVLTFALACLAATAAGVLTDGAVNGWLGSRSLPGIFLHVFAHSGWEHLTGNMMYVLLLGPMLEEKYGSKRLAMMILANAVVTSLFVRVAQPGVNLVGASGVVFMMILLSSFAGASDGAIPVTFIIVACMYLGREVYDMAFVRDNVSQLAHVVGGVVGSVTGWLMSRNGKEKNISETP